MAVRGCVSCLPKIQIARQFSINLFNATHRANQHFKGTPLSYYPEGFSCSITDARHFHTGTGPNKGKQPSMKHNYGLKGLAKKKYRPQLVVPETRGEFLFGLHPVYLALKAKKRDVYKLYVKYSHAEQK